MIEQFDERDALHFYVLPSDVSIELDLNDELIGNFQKAPEFKDSTFDPAISIAAESMLSIEELIEAYRIEFQKIYGRFPEEVRLDYQVTRRTAMNCCPYDDPVTMPRVCR
jgi:hypothetical protein